jgi:hypothetical protein
MNTCRACPAPVIWAHHKVTNKPNLLDSQPADDGNLLFDEHTRLYEVLTSDDLKQAKEQGIKLYISHFATCVERQRMPRVKPLTLPEELLASAATKPAAESPRPAIIPTIGFGQQQNVPERSAPRRLKPTTRL